MRWVDEAQYIAGYYQGLLGGRKPNSYLSMYGKGHADGTADRLWYRAQNQIKELADHQEKIKGQLRNGRNV